jgi:hypothetical protein
MKKTICLLMLLGINGGFFAQEDNRKTKADNTFELPPDYPKRRFIIDLERGNKLQIELVHMSDLNRFVNMDSVLRIFFQDIAFLKDSLADELGNKRIDYLFDSTSLKKIRLQQFKTAGTSYLVKDGEIALLKLEQDTVNFIGKVSYVDEKSKKETVRERYYRLSFLVNKLNDLAGYMDGRLNEKVRTIIQDVNTTWVTTPGKAYLKTDNLITARYGKGYVAGGDYLNLRISVDVQNYKNYFVPSFSIGPGIVFTTSHWKREIVLAWEPNFFFGRNADGKLQTFRNDFLTVSAGHGPIQDNNPRKESHLVFIASFSYLVNRQGDSFENGTMRLGAGRLSLFNGKTKLEPALYFTNLFKGVTPGLRWIQSF